MNFDRMRALLLDQAIRGELVPQLAKEGEVDQIGAVPEQVPFAIPEKWKWVRLSDLVLKHLGGGTPSKLNVNFWNGDIPWASVKDLKGTVLSTTQDSITEEGLNNSSSNLIPAGTVIVCTRMGLGKVAINTVPVAINQDLRALFLSEKIDKNYFLHFYSGMKIEGAGTTVKGIKLTELLNLLIPLPPVEEQIRIVAKLEETFAEIDRAEKAYEELQTLAGVLRGQILQEAIQGKLVPQLAEEGVVEQIGVAPDERPFEIPKSWKWRALDEIFKFVDYRGKTPTKTTDGVRLITASNVRQGYVDHKRIEFISSEEYIDRQNRGISKKGDILFTTEAPLGNVALADLDVYSAGQRVITLQTDSENKKLLMYFMLSPYFQKALKNNATGTTAQGIKAARLKKLMLPVPPVEEQARIASKVEELLKQVDALSA